jgi:two-component system, cell cycle response regulator
MREKTTVLLAVSDLVEHSQLESALTEHGFRVTSAQDAASVVTIAESIHPDVLLLGIDFTSPQGGLTLCRLLRGNVKTRTCSIVLLCGRNEKTFPSLGGTALPDEVLIRPLFLPEVLFRLGSVQKLQRITYEITEGSKMDTLTGTFNNSYLLDRLRHEILRANRYGRSLAIVLIDLDQFSKINKRHGTNFGDLVLREVARALTSRLRGVDLVARTGSDDFSVVLPETSLLVARPIAERLRQCIELLGSQIADEDNRQIQLTASLGIAGIPHPSIKDLPGFLTCARAALSRAQQAGGNRSEIY